jgi:hypothetical protein
MGQSWGEAVFKTFRLDTTRTWCHCYPMTIIIVLAVALAAGIIFRSRWALLLPLGIGACTALALVAGGYGLGDTPIPFLVVVCTLVMVGGQGLRPRVMSPVS